MRGGFNLYTLEDSHIGYVQVGKVLIVAKVVVLSPSSRSDPMLQGAAPSRYAHMQHTSDLSSSVEQGMEEW
jgi:hypothetical protein